LVLPVKIRKPRFYQCSKLPSWRRRSIYPTGHKENNGRFKPLGRKYRRRFYEFYRGDRPSIYGLSFSTPLSTFILPSFFPPLYLTTAFAPSMPPADIPPIHASHKSKRTVF
jgi:hypothetical protein